MRDLRFKKTLETASSVAVVVVAILVIYVSTWNYFRKSPNARTSVGLQTGQIIEPPLIVDYKQSTKTLVIALTTKCSNCQSKIAFYKKLIEMNSPNRIRIVAVFPDSDREVNTFLQQNQLEVESVPTANLEASGIVIMPTLVLLDGAGKIADFWIGDLSANQEQQVISQTGLRML